VKNRSLLLTGGTGRLGTELKALLSGLIAPPREELDILRTETIEAALDRYLPGVVVHAAAYTDVARAEKDRRTCWQVNVEGTRNLVRALSGRKISLIHISTDYVFYGDCGNYREEDPVGPVRNFYALSKLAAEEVARVVPGHLVIRTSFRPRQWPYPVAFTDFFTSQDYVDVVAPDIALAVIHKDEIPHDTLHIATERKSVYELARQRKPDVRPGSKATLGVDLPDDISMDTSRWKKLKATWSRSSGA
jgi:dTDP-4-dehydrorhamnose reductase